MKHKDLLDYLDFGASIFLIQDKVQLLCFKLLGKNEFEWGNKQQAFELDKEAIQKALDLRPLEEEVELHVSVNELYADWSLWKGEQGKRKVPLRFWNQKLPEAGKNYTPFEKELLL